MIPADKETILKKNLIFKQQKLADRPDPYSLAELPLIGLGQR